MTPPQALRSESPLPEARRFLLALWQEGAVREVRIPRHNKYRQTASGYFDDPVKLLQAAAAWDGKANLYVTLNPVYPALLGRAANHIVERADATTSDSDVLHREWLFLDIDPVRPSGISSTNTELAAAEEVLGKVMVHLARLGWPEPLTAMSGNGCYALFRIDLPNDSSSLDLVTGVLRRIAETCDTEAAHIDTTVSNAGRIVGLVGTKKVKGDELPDRPHRLSVLRTVPRRLTPVSREQLEALAGSVPQPKRGRGTDRRVARTALGRAWHRVSRAVSGREGVHLVPRTAVSVPR